MIYKFKNGSKIPVSHNWQNRRLNNRQINRYGLGSKFLTAAGVDEEEHPFLHLGADLLTYVNPYTGLASSAIDGYEALKEGRYGDAAVEAAFAIPFVGGIAKGVKSSKKILSAANKGNKAAKKVVKTAQKVSKKTSSTPARLATGAAWGYTAEDIGNTVWENRDALWNAAKDYLKKLF